MVPESAQRRAGNRSYVHIVHPRFFITYTHKAIQKTSIRYISLFKIHWDFLSYFYVLVRVHFFRAKEAVLLVSKKNLTLLKPFTSVRFFLDLSAATIQNRRKLTQINAMLQHHKVPYKWGYPTKLLVNKFSISHYYQEPREWDIALQRMAPRSSATSHQVPRCSPPHTGRWDII